MLSGDGLLIRPLEGYCLDPGTANDRPLAVHWLLLLGSPAMAWRGQPRGLAAVAEAMRQRIPARRPFAGPAPHQHARSISVSPRWQSHQKPDAAGAGDPASAGGGSSSNGAWAFRAAAAAGAAGIGTWVRAESTRRVALCRPILIGACARHAERMSPRSHGQLVARSLGSACFTSMTRHCDSQ